MKRNAAARSLALLLCLVMCLSLMPTALAADAEEPAEELWTEEPVSELGEEIPAEEAPAEGLPAEEPAEAPQEEPVAEEPTEELPAEELPAEELPAEEPAEAPAEEPVVEEPAEVLPEEELPAEEPVEEPTEDPILPRRVIFSVEPANAAVTVYDKEKKDENGEPLVIRPEEDLVYLLLPGEYLYTAAADGYETVEKQPLTVVAAEEPLLVNISLTAIPAEEPTEEPVEEPVGDDASGVPENPAEDPMEETPAEATPETDQMPNETPEVPEEPVVSEPEGSREPEEGPVGSEDLVGAEPLPGDELQVHYNLPTDEYLKKCKAQYNAYAKGTAKVNLTQIWNMPCSNSTNKRASVSCTLSKGAEMTIIKVISNSEGNLWYQVTFDTTDSCSTGYVYNSDVTHDSGASYVTDKCTTYHCKIKVTGSGAPIYSLPCNHGDSNYFSNRSSTTLTSGTSMQLVKNHAGNYWYKVGDNQYVSASDVESEILEGSLNSTVTKYPKGKREPKAMDLDGDFSSPDLKIAKVETKVINGTTGAKVTGGATTSFINKMSYKMEGKEPDTKCQLAKANDKTVLYTYTITVTLRNYYSSDGKTLSTSDKAYKVHSSQFWVGQDKPTDKTYTVTYNANGGSGAPGSDTKYHNVDMKLSTDTPSRTGYTFKGWATSSTATTAQYQPGGSYSKNANLTLYAVWEANKYTITYDANGGSGAPSVQTKTYGVDLTLSTTKPTRGSVFAGEYTVTLNANGGSVSTTSVFADRTTKYTFKNWNTAPNGTGTNYSAGGIYSANSPGTLYAQWNSSTTTSSVTLPTPTRTGYTFQGWATSSSASSGTTGKYTPTGNVTLYAIWKANPNTSNVTPVISSISNTVNGVKLTWGAVSGAAKYAVYRKAEGESKYTRYTITKATSYTDKNAVNGTFYYFRVWSMDSAGNTLGDWSNARGITCVKSVSPTITSISNTGSGVKVTWSAVSGVAKYAVYRKAEGESKYSRYTITKATSYTDTKAVDGTFYYYRIWSMDSSGNLLGEWSNGRAITCIRTN